MTFPFSSRSFDPLRREQKTLELIDELIYDTMLILLVDEESMSRPVSKGSSKDEIALRDGKSVQVREAVESFKFLEISREYRPREFEAILIIAGKKQGTPNDTEYQSLKEAGIIDEKGRLAELYQSIVDSSVQEVAPGEYELLLPCRPDQEADWDRWHQEELRFEQNLLRNYKAVKNIADGSLPGRR